MTIKNLVLVLSLGAMSGLAYGQDRSHMPELDAATKKAVEACKDLKPERPEHGKAFTKEDKEAMHAKFETFRACVEKNGGKLPQMQHRRGAQHKQPDQNQSSD